MNLLIRPAGLNGENTVFRLSNLGAFVFEFTLDAVLIKSAVVFALIRYVNIEINYLSLLTQYHGLVQLADVFIFCCLLRGR